MRLSKEQKPTLAKPPAFPKKAPIIDVAEWMATKIEVLTRQLKYGDNNTKEAVASAFGNALMVEGSRDATALVLAEALKDGDSDVRKEAAQALGNFINELAKKDWEATVKCIALLIQSSDGFIYAAEKRTSEYIGLVEQFAGILGKMRGDAA
ncbi:MAG: hypothetical protein ACP5NX_02525 [Candidatus Bilamarchaeaceae archaeon]